MSARDDVAAVRPSVIRRVVTEALDDAERHGMERPTTDEWVAIRLLASPAFKRLIADAEQRGREDNAQHDLCYPHGSKALAGLLDEVRAEALREAADAWTQGQWSDVLLPKPTPPAVPVIAYANRVGDWLRGRIGGDA